MIDFQAGEPQFVDHLAPIWLALPPEHRGDFLAVSSLRARARALGVDSLARVEHPDRPILVASYGDQKRVRRQGRKTIARIEHGAGQSYFGDPRFAGNASYAGGRDCHDVSLFLCPNEQSADRWRTTYPNADVEVVGCPKLDSLPGREHLTAAYEPVVCASFHFNIPIIPETTWSWPTYKAVLPDLAQRFNLIAHAHPKGLPLMQRFYMRAGVEVVPDFAEVCKRADVYVCDNSSTLFEFASTGRPVVVLNDPQFRRDVVHGLRFWDAANVGIQVDRPQDLIPAVELALADPSAAQANREAALDIAYTYRTGAAQRAADALLVWAGVAQEVAA